MVAKPFSKTAKTGRQALPYNSYVQHHRLDQYYEKKKAQKRYQRLQRFDERQQADGSTPDGSRFTGLLAKGQETEAEEYERKLQLSFGGDEPREAPKARQKKKKKRNEEVGDDVGSDPKEGTSVDVTLSARSRVKGSKRKAVGTAIETETPTNEKQIGHGAFDVLVADKEKKSEKRQKKEKKRVPDRFAKQLREYDAQQEVARLERERKQDEFKQRNRRRKESAKGRAITGSLLSQRTSWGQPRMSSMLEMVTSKLQREVGASTAPQAHRAHR